MGLTHTCTCRLLSFSSLNVSELASTVNCPKKHKQGMRPGLSGFFVSFLSSSPLPANPRVLPEKQRNPSVSTPSWYHNPRSVLSRRKYDIRPPRQFSKQRAGRDHSRRHSSDPAHLRQVSVLGTCSRRPRYAISTIQFPGPSYIAALVGAGWSYQANTSRTSVYSQASSRYIVLGFDPNITTRPELKHVHRSISPLVTSASIPSHRLVL
ncbi:hypothetical protein B0T13DRAFT_15093 [Neurospora crassa]|nr:hypothetical protein B0T13DRAFT_15093 [Neurospora crassa]